MSGSSRAPNVYKPTRSRDPSGSSRAPEAYTPTGPRDPKEVLSYAGLKVSNQAILYHNTKPNYLLTGPTEQLLSEQEFEPKYLTLDLDRLFFRSIPNYENLKGNWVTNRTRDSDPHGYFTPDGSIVAIRSWLDRKTFEDRSENNKNMAKLQEIGLDLGKFGLKCYGKYRVQIYSDTMDEMLQFFGSIKLSRASLSNLELVVRGAALREEMVAWYLLAQELLLLCDKTAVFDKNNVF